MKITMDCDAHDITLRASDGAVGLKVADYGPDLWLTPADAEALQLVLGLTIEAAKAQAAVKGAG